MLHHSKSKSSTVRLVVYINRYSYGKTHSRLRQLLKLNDSLEVYDYLLINVQCLYCHIKHKLNIEVLILSYYEVINV